MVYNKVCFLLSSSGTYSCLYKDVAFPHLTPTHVPLAKTGLLTKPKDSGLRIIPLSQGRGLQG